MIQECSALRNSVTQFCAEIGSDPLIVQGAGGNVSWKDGCTLWVKASGAWLADAAGQAIFVPVDLGSLRIAIDEREFSVVPKVLGLSGLRPSIETLLHALMPHTVVVHVHAVGVLALLVRGDPQVDLELRIGKALDWAYVDYYKPGAELAEAIHAALLGRRSTQVVFMKNHGLVVGGVDVEGIRDTLNAVFTLLRTPAVALPQGRAPISEHGDYVALSDLAVQALAQNSQLFHRLGTDWAICPDHVVFLGPAAHTYESWSDFKQALSSAAQPPELVFIRYIGVFTTHKFSQAKAAQLRCYLDILVRQPLGAVLQSLSELQVAHLLNWDSEKYRQQLER